MFNFFGNLRRKSALKKRAASGPRVVPPPGGFKEISSRLDINEAFLRQAFSETTDIVFREFYAGETRCLAVWVDGLIDKRISHDLFHSLMLDLPREQLQKVPSRNLTDYLNKHFLAFYSTALVSDLFEIKRWVLMAKVILLIDGNTTGLMLDAGAPPARAITEPVLESSVSGPRDSFVESLRVNTALIRSRLGDANLKSENFILGRRSNTMVTLLYVQDLANPEIIKEARRRISRVDLDAMLDSSYLKELIQDRTFTVFPLIKNTERPDKVVADLMEGRFAVIVNGSPQVLTAPTVFIEFLQTADDYYLNPIATSLVRLLRYVALFFASNLPGIYVALTTFHQEMIPIPLVFSIAGARETVPFPAYFDALFLLITFELLWESSIRLPRVIGAAINIIGALILGQAAVQSGLVSPTLVIVISATAISNFAIGSGYELALSLRVIRLIILTAGALAGFYGIAITSLAFLLHMASLRSFGVPYLEPLAPLLLKEMKDMIYRAPRWDMTKRPEHITGEDTTRSATPPPSRPSAKSRAAGSPQSQTRPRKGES